MPHLQALPGVVGAFAAAEALAGVADARRVTRKTFATPSSLSDSSELLKPPSDSSSPELRPSSLLEIWARELRNLLSRALERSAVVPDSVLRRWDFRRW